MSLRDAELSDLPAIMAMADPVWAEIQPGIEVHRGQAAATLRGLIASPDGLVSVLDDGAGLFGGLVAACSASLWTQGMSAVCYLRWVAPDRRGRWGHVLTRRFERWARLRGARIAGLSQTGRAATGYYERLGYTPAERMFFKVL